MARIARVVAANSPHHVIQRGNRRQRTFFCEEDYRIYLQLMAEWFGRGGVEIWSYCLMPNHVHLIAVPESEIGLRSVIGEAHRRYTRHVNSRQDWKGHLWQGRFASYVMDESYLLAAARYIELNPVNAGLVKTPAAYPWSSAKAHIQGKDDSLVTVGPLIDMMEDWGAFLSSGISDDEYATLCRHERTGRPLGSEQFIRNLENQLSRVLVPQRGGRPSKIPKN